MRCMMALMVVTRDEDGGGDGDEFPVRLGILHGGYAWNSPSIDKQGTGITSVREMGVHHARIYKVYGESMHDVHLILLGGDQVGPNRKA